MKQEASLLEAVEDLVEVIDKAKLHMDIISVMFLREDCEDIVVAHRRLKKILDEIKTQSTG